MLKICRPTCSNNCTLRYVTHSIDVTFRKRSQVCRLWETLFTCYCLNHCAGVVHLCNVHICIYHLYTHVPAVFGLDRNINNLSYLEQKKSLNQRYIKGTSHAVNTKPLSSDTENVKFIKSIPKSGKLHMLEKL